MNLLKVIRNWINQLIGIRQPFLTWLLIQFLLLNMVITSCDSDPYGSNWNDEDSFSISQFIEKNREEYSKFYRLLVEAKMLNTLYAYNPYGEDYTLFLPTDEAIDDFILENNNYESFEELIKDTGFIKILTRYHTLNRKISTNEFPDGALYDKTLTGERLVTGFHAVGDNQLIKVNNSASIIKPDLKMTNGYIHVISEVLQHSEISGYEWLQQRKDYSILAEAVNRSGIKNRLWNKYTLLAEHDSIYHKNGINNVEELIERITTPGMSVSNKNNSLYQFAAFHFIVGEYYLNDLFWGNKMYNTLAGKPLTIDTGQKIKMNLGVDIYGYIISDKGDTTIIDYISPEWEQSNILTKTGPVHSISELLYFEPLPGK